VKVGSLRRKPRYIAGGHITELPAAVTYASVVRSECFQIGLLVAALIELNIISADIKNTYLTSPCEEKIYTVLVPEFSLIVRVGNHW
jgi:hypothetical protein